MEGRGRVWGIVVAGGAGARFGGPKQFAELAGRPVVSWSVAAARRACDGVVLVVPAGGDPAEAGGDATPSWAEVASGADVVVTGGATRSASVRAGLAAVPRGAEVVAVHDAARPLASDALWQAVLGALESGADAAVPAVPVTDTVKERQDDGRLVTLERSRLVAVQTPQAFRADVLRRVHGSALDATDDAALVEQIGGRVVLVEGDPCNLKLTAPTDLVVAAALAAGGIAAAAGGGSWGRGRASSG